MKKVLISALLMIGILSSLQVAPVTTDNTTIKLLNHGANY